MLGLVKHVSRAFRSLLYGVILKHLESICIQIHICFRTFLLCFSSTLLLALLTLLLRCAFEWLLISIFLFELCLSSHNITHSCWRLLLFWCLHYFDVNFLFVNSGLALFLNQVLFKLKLNLLLIIPLIKHLFLYFQLIFLQLLQYLGHISLGLLLVLIWLLPFSQIHFKLRPLIWKLLSLYTLHLCHGLRASILPVFLINLIIDIFQPCLFMHFFNFYFWLK